MKTYNFAKNIEIYASSKFDLFEIYGTVNQALENTYQYLSNFRFDTEYTEKLKTTFGNDFDEQIANQLFDKFAQGDFIDTPNIKIVNRNSINDANGAFSQDTNLIYLASEFITENANNIQAITDVLLEETGHFIDTQINTIDTAGDEGDIFARLVQGESISEQELAVLQAENDTATVRLNGQLVEIEMNRTWVNGREYKVRYGTDGNDNLQESYNDPIWNVNHNEIYYGGNGNDTIKAVFGYDIVYGGNGDDSIDGGTWDDILYGEEGNDYIHGGRISDFFGSGSDFLDGGDGNDILIGDDDSDTLKGGAGNDLLVTGSLDGTAPLSNETDDYEDLTGGTGIDIFFVGTVGNSSTNSSSDIVGNTFNVLGSISNLMANLVTTRSKKFTYVGLVSGVIESVIGLVNTVGESLASTDWAKVKRIRDFQQHDILILPNNESYNIRNESRNFGDGAGNIPGAVITDDNDKPIVFLDGVAVNDANSSATGGFINSRVNGYTHNGITYTSLNFIPYQEVMIFSDRAFHADSRYSKLNNQGIRENVKLRSGFYDVGILNTYRNISNNTDTGNDSISSLRVAPGFVVELYSDPGFKGEKRVVEEDIYDLGDYNFDNKTSSIIVGADPRLIAPTDFNDVIIPSSLFITAIFR